MERFGHLDTLVNNVGISGPPGTAVEVDEDAWDRALRVNVTSMMLMAKHAIPQMVRAGGGAIVNIASYAGLFGGHPALLYPTTKGAVVNLTRAMAAHHAEQGIRVNAIAPGMVYTPMVYADGMSDEIREARKNRSLLKVEGTGWDIGNGVVYLVSDEGAAFGSPALSCPSTPAPPPHPLGLPAPRRPERDALTCATRWSPSPAPPPRARACSPRTAIANRRKRAEAVEIIPGRRYAPGDDGPRDLHHHSPDRANLDWRCFSAGRSGSGVPRWAPMSMASSSVMKRIHAVIPSQRGASA